MRDDRPIYSWQTADNSNHIIQSIPDFAEVLVGSQLYEMTWLDGHIETLANDVHIVADYPRMSRFFDVYRAKCNALTCTEKPADRVQDLVSHINCFRDSLYDVYPKFLAHADDANDLRVNGMPLSQAFADGFAVCSEVSMLGLRAFETAPFDVTYFSGGVVCDATHNQIEPHAFLVVDDTYVLDLLACCAHPDQTPYILQPVCHVSVQNYLDHLQQHPDCDTLLLACQKINGANKQTYYYGTATCRDFDRDKQLAETVIASRPATPAWRPVTPA